MFLLCFVSYINCTVLHQSMVVVSYTCTDSRNAYSWLRGKAKGQQRIWLMRIDLPRLPSTYYLQRFISTLSVWPSHHLTAAIFISKYLWLFIFTSMCSIAADCFALTEPRWLTGYLALFFWTPCSDWWRKCRFCLVVNVISGSWGHLDSSFVIMQWFSSGKNF